MCAAGLQENGGPPGVNGAPAGTTSEASEGPVQLESLCMECRENGTTTILLTEVPHFRELAVYSFECPHCGNRNNEVQFAGAFGEQGVRYALSVPEGAADALSRQVVKSDSATVTVPELEFEIPAQTQKGVITTVEGLLREAAAGLAALQPERHASAPEAAAAIDAFLGRLEACCSGTSAFTLELEDPAGNSYVESPDGDVQADGLLRVHRYERSPEQARAIGLSTGDDEAAEEAATQLAEINVNDPHHGVMPRGAAAAHAALARMHGPSADALMARYTAPEDVMELPGHCGACGAAAATRMYRTSIPFFKEVIIFCNACDACGYKSSEVKGAGGISPQGRRISVRVSEQADLRRDVIKAESAALSVPELDLEVTTGVFGGLVTTVEGLVVAVRDSLQRMHAFQLGDSAVQGQRTQWQQFFASLEAFIALEQPWTLVLTDPLANTFVAPCTEDLADDLRLTMEDYVRSAEEEAELGIDHLKEMDSVD